MPNNNNNGRTERDDARQFADQQYRSFTADSNNIEHGYQDPRDQWERSHGRDDFRGGDFANRNFQTTDRNQDDRSPRGLRGISQVGDEYAERDRSMSGDRRVEPTGYGYDDGNPQPNQQMNYRGQSGAGAGGRGNGAYRGPAAHGGNEGQWGEFSQGGQSRGPHAGKGPKGFTRSDDRIRELVHEVLTEHGHVDATNIVVDVKSGEVTLTGTVDDRAAKRLAEDLAATVVGVKDVHNQVRIKQPS